MLLHSTARRIVNRLLAAALLAGTGLAGQGLAHAQAQAQAAAPTQAQTSIRVGYLTSISRGFKISHDAGRFDGKPYQLRLTEFASPNDALASIEAGQQDLVYAEFARGVAAIKSGYKLVYVAANGLQVPRAYFLTRADKPLAGKDLKGKKVGVGTAPFYYVHTVKWLESLGLTVSPEAGKADVQIIKIAESALPPALQNGDIDVVHTWDRINAYQWIHDFKFRFVEGAQDGAPVGKFLSPRTFTGGFFARPEFLRRHPELVRQFDRDNRLATRWYEELRPAEQRQLWEKAGGKSLNALGRQLDAKTFDSLLAQRATWVVDPDESFDLAPLAAWIDLVADLTGSVPSTRDIDLRGTVASYLLK